MQLVLDSGNVMDDVNQHLEQFTHSTDEHAQRCFAAASAMLADADASMREQQITVAAALKDLTVAQRSIFEYLQAGSGGVKELERLAAAAVRSNGTAEANGKGKGKGKAVRFGA